MYGGQKEQGFGQIVTMDISIVKYYISGLRRLGLRTRKRGPELVGLENGRTGQNYD